MGRWFKATLTPMTTYRGILVKLVICVVPGHWKIEILNLKKKISFFCFFFMFLYPIQGGKNNGSPYLTNKSCFFKKSDVPGQQNKSYIGVWASKNLIFLMFWLSFVYSLVHKLFPVYFSLLFSLCPFLNCPGITKNVPA